MNYSTATKGSNNNRHSLRENQSTENKVSICELLHKDHIKVSNMFFEYEQLKVKKEKELLVEKILRELFVHSSAEEQVVYRAMRKESISTEEDTKSLIDESETEHHMIKVLMAELSKMQPSDKLYDAKVSVLGELVRHHVREEEKYTFNKMKEAQMDLDKLGKTFMTKKDDLQTFSSPVIAQYLNEELHQA